MDFEIVGDRAGDVALEQNDQPGAGDGQRDQDRDDAAGDQPQPQRAPSHAQLLRHDIAEAAAGLDQLGAELAAHAADQHLERVRSHGPRRCHRHSRRAPAARRRGRDAAADRRRRDIRAATASTGTPRTLTFICRSSSVTSPTATTDDAWPAERRTIARRRDSSSSMLERLGQIIVGAGVDAVDALGPAAARGQDQHRHAAAVGAPALEHRQAVHLRQAEIEDDGAIIFGVAAKPGLLAVARRSRPHSRRRSSARSTSAAIRRSSSTSSTRITSP